MNKTSEQSMDYLYFINVISAFAVLTIHTSGCFWWFDAEAPYWKSANVIECLLYFAVPMFFMSTGITLMDFFDRYSLKEYFVKRTRKTFIPFLAWSFIAVIGKIAAGQLSLQALSPKALYQSIIGNTIVDIYWFFTALFAIYLSLPLFAAVEKSKRKIVFTYLVVAGFLLNIFIPFMRAITGIDLTTPYTVTVVSDALIWLPLGWLLHNCKLSKGQKVFVFVLAVVGFLLHLIGTYELSIKAGEIVKTYKGYYNVPSVLYASGVFILLKDIGSKVMQTRAARCFKWLSGYTLPVYLMQYIFFSLVTIKTSIDQTSMIYRLGAPFVIAPIIILVTWCMRKVPVLKMIVP